MTIYPATTHVNMGGAEPWPSSWSTPFNAVKHASWIATLPAEWMVGWFHFLGGK